MKKLMKLISIFVALSAMSVMLAGCPSDDAEGTDSDTGTTSPTGDVDGGDIGGDDMGGDDMDGGDDDTDGGGDDTDGGDDDADGDYDGD